VGGYLMLVMGNFSGSSPNVFPEEIGDFSELGVISPKSESPLSDICGDKAFSGVLLPPSLFVPLIVSSPSCPDRSGDPFLSLVTDLAFPLGSFSSSLSLLSPLGSFDGPACEFGSGICVRRFSI
jgi:hypothetical protein